MKASQLTMVFIHLQSTVEEYQSTVLAAALLQVNCLLGISRLILIQSTGPSLVSRLILVPMVPVGKVS